MNQKELTELIEAYGREIYSFCLSLTGNRADADDLYQDSFLTVIRKMSSITIETNPKSYMLTVVIRRWKDNKRKYARRRRLVSMDSLDRLETERGNYAGNPAEEADISGDFLSASGLTADFQPEKALLNREMQWEIRKQVSKLDDRMRIPVYLYYMEDLSVTEISRIMHLPQGTIKSRLHRARRILKEKMIGLGYEL